MMLHWLDKLQVYVGLPDWALTEEQMLSTSLPKVPVWLLESLSDATESNLNSSSLNKIVACLREIMTPFFVLLALM